jgi:hypothetical protein
MNIYQKKVEDLIVEASRWIGVIEEGGDNSGKVIELFQKTIDNKAVKEPWCCAFVQYCVREVDKAYEKKHEGPNEGTVLYPTEHCLTLWNKTPKIHRLIKPEIGCLILWQYFKHGEPTTNGHIGIITKLVELNKILTVEGNTGPGKFIQREGDGVYEKERFWRSPYTSTMHVLGFLRCWNKNI